jgi:hypothetical protein
MQKIKNREILLLRMISVADLDDFWTDPDPDLPFQIV